MRVQLAIAAAILALAASTYAADADKIQVKPFMKPGTYVLTMKDSGSNDFAGQKTTWQGDIVIELAVSAPDTDGQKFVMTGKLLRRTNVDLNGKQTTHEEEPKGARLELVIDANGDVTKWVEKDPESQPSSGPSAEDLKKTGRARLGQLLPHVLCATSQPVAAGETWEAPFGSTGEKAKVKLASLTKDAAEFVLEQSTEDKTQSRKRQIKFTIRYDRELQAATTTTGETHSEASIQIDPQATKPAMMIMDGKIELSLKPGKYEAPASQPASAPVLIKD